MRGAHQKEDTAWKVPNVRIKTLFTTSVQAERTLNVAFQLHSRSQSAKVRRAVAKMNVENAKEIFWLAFVQTSQVLSNVVWRMK